ncbi:MAG: ferredoxin:glutaredoxin reductase [Candidatus Thermoplasmatota archaeon]|nr:ferredoxin:glutaredoxin reductase [Candidatus Thermoplasmatota archaeon]
MTQTDVILQAMKKNAVDNGYFLCPDTQLLQDLIKGLAVNTQRYGYGSCPCRIASGVKTYDADIICPCEYRDADVDEFGMCYCGLFVRKEVHADSSKMRPIPERRPQEVQDAALAVAEGRQGTSDKHTGTSTPAVREEKKVKVWRCTVCGYLCARETPPPVCPICKAKAERFKHFLLEK